MKSQKGIVHLFLIFGILAALVLGGGYILLRPSSSSPIRPTPTPTAEVVSTTAPIAREETPTPTTRLTPTSVVRLPSPTIIVASPLPTAVSATVIFENESSIPAGDRDQITTKIIEPYLLYYQDYSGQGTLTRLTVKLNPNPSRTTYPYLADTLFSGGVTEGFTIAKSGGTIDWWVPTCMGACPFSATFRSRYPQIVSRTNP